MLGNALMFLHAAMLPRMALLMVKASQPKRAAMPAPAYEPTPVRA